MYFLHKFMSLALEEAKKTSIHQDIPVGCIIEKDGEIIASAFNTRERDKDPLGHAELKAIKEASKALNDWRLTDCNMYVTLEPCPMCADAIRQARIKNLYFGTFNKKEGAAGTCMNLLYPHVNVYGGILIDDCQDLLNKFFKDLRSP